MQRVLVIGNFSQHKHHRPSCQRLDYDLIALQLAAPTPEMMAEKNTHNSRASAKGEQDVQQRTGKKIPPVSQGSEATCQFVRGLLRRLIARFEQ
jgi:hypothetical protein